MLSVIVDARTGARKLPALLAQLTTGAVDGIVREVLIVGPGQPGVDALCEQTGAVGTATLAEAGLAAKSDRVMVLPADFRLRDGWIGALNRHMAEGAQPARVEGLGQGGLFRRSPSGVLVERRVLQQVGDDVAALRRRLRRRVG